MDIDVFLSNTMTTQNAPNTLLTNDGNGNFSTVTIETGAEGTALGRGGSLLTADYDNNGTMDIFSENGHGLYFNHGPLKLFRNNRTENNWIQLNLVGTTSNRDAVGALIYCYSGGVAQVRLNQLGIHKFGQDFKRIHFGLGQNILVDSVVIYWPSGSIQTLENLNSNQILTVVEEETTTFAIENIYNNHINIYPVPFSDNITIEPIKGFSDMNIHVRMIDVSGKIIYNRYFDQFNNAITITDFIGEAGVYQIEIEGDHLHLSQKVIKM